MTAKPQSSDHRRLPTSPPPLRAARPTTTDSSSAHILPVSGHGKITASTASGHKVQHDTDKPSESASLNLSGRTCIAPSLLCGERRKSKRAALKKQALQVWFRLHISGSGFIISEAKRVSWCLSGLARRVVVVLPRPWTRPGPDACGPKAGWAHACLSGCRLFLTCTSIPQGP